MGKMNTNHQANRTSRTPRVVIALLSFLLPAAMVAAQPIVVSYQGQLTNAGGGAVPDSTYDVLFSLYTSSTGGASLWSESAQVTTDQGRFSHALGSITALPRTLLLDNNNLYLQISLGGVPLIPRTKLLTVPYAAIAGDLKSTDDTGVVAIATDPRSRQLWLTDSTGTPTIVLSGNTSGDSSLVLPENAINADETLDEPGIAVDQSSTLITLPTSEMIDLDVVSITIPRDGYIVLYGKCYAILSGTTGPNRARVQIDETEGGAAIYPYYTIAGLGGYVNTGESYFPMYVTRTYYKTAGTYEFRLEGKADQSPPALARTWDHILTAVYYPTQYENVKASVLNPAGFPGAVRLPADDSLRGYISPPVYQVDLKKKTDSTKVRK